MHGQGELFLETVTVCCYGYLTRILLRRIMKALAHTTQLSSKGQIVIPKSVRKVHFWKEGMMFLVEDKKDGLWLKPLNPFQTTTLEEVVGCTRYHGPTKSFIDMDKAIMREARKHKK